MEFYYMVDSISNSKKDGLQEITFCLLVKDEEKNLRELIPELKRQGGEILIADTGSTDGSILYLNSQGINPMSVLWTGDFAEARNHLLGKAQTLWIFMIDADERVSSELFEEVRAVVAGDNECNGYFVPRKNYFLGKWLRYGGQYPDYQLKIFKREYASFSKNVHEKTVLTGRTGTLTGHILHYSYPSVSAYLKKFDLYTALEAASLRKKEIALSPVQSFRFLFFKPAVRFTKRYIFKGGFLDGVPGFFAAVFDALGIMVRYFKLWELSRQNND